jgi:hypothetical protein
MLARGMVAPVNIPLAVTLAPETKTASGLEMT